MFHRCCIDVVGQGIGDDFLTMAPFLKLYSQYVSNHDQATTCLRDWARRRGGWFLREQRARDAVTKVPGAEDAVKDYLIQPVQALHIYIYLCISTDMPTCMCIHMCTQLYLITASPAACCTPERVQPHACVCTMHVNTPLCVCSGSPGTSCCSNA